MLLSFHLYRYIIFFSPFDIAYYLSSAMPILLVLSGIEEFARVKKVFLGVVMASKLYPQSVVAMAIVGMFKSKLYGSLVVLCILSRHY